MSAGFFQWVVEWVWVPLATAVAGLYVRHSKLATAEQVKEVSERLARIEGYLDGKREQEA